MTIEDKLIDFIEKQPKPRWTDENIKIFNRLYQVDLSKGGAISKYYRRKAELEKLDNGLYETETLADGSIVSKVLLKGTTKRDITQGELLKLHNFDAKEWVIKKVVSNVWTVNTKEKEKYNFQSKIIVEPIVKEIDIKGLIDEEIKRVKPFEVKLQSKKPKCETSLVAINVSDTHFTGDGTNYFEDLNRLNYKLCDIKHKHKNLVICLNLLGDVVNIDTVKGQTTKGTQLQTFDVEGQLNDALMFFDYLFSIMQGTAVKIHVQGVAGNHDNTLSYYIYRLLEQRYQNDNITFDISRKDNQGLMKVFYYGKVLIGITHGDKTNKNIPMLVATQYPKAWSATTTRELFKGHIHHEKTQIIETGIDDQGLVIRTVPTAKPNDTYEQQNGFIDAKKRFAAVVYDSQRGTDEIIYW